MPYQLKPKDIFVSVNGQALRYFDQSKAIFAAHKGKQVAAVVLHDGKETPVTLSVNQEGKLGIAPAEVTEANLEKLGYYKFNTETFGFFEPIPIGIEKGFTQLENYWKQLKLIFNPSTGAYKGVGIS